MREENFALKQKQREHMMSVNQLRQENEQLLDHAETEIKRMSEFVDKFTQEAELNKAKLIADFEQRIQQERNKNEEVKARLISDKNDAEMKAYKLQKDADQLRTENQVLQQAKADAMQKQVDLFEQLEQAKQQIRAA